MRLVDARKIENFAHEGEFGTEDMVENWIGETDIPVDIKAEYEEELKGLCWKVLEDCMNITKTEPTAYDLQQVVQQLEERAKEAHGRFMDAVCYTEFEKYSQQYREIKACLGIVKAGAIKGDGLT